MSIKKLLFFLILFTNFFIKPAELRFINSSDKTLNVKLRGWKRMYGLVYRQEDLREVKAGGALTWTTVLGKDIKKDEDKDSEKNILDVCDINYKLVISITMPLVNNVVVPNECIRTILFVDKTLYDDTVEQNGRKLSGIYSIGINLLQKSLEAVEEVLFTLFSVTRKLTRENKDPFNPEPYDIIRENAYVKKDAQVRVGGSVACDDEKKVFEKRQDIVKKAQENFLGTKFGVNEKPLVVAFVASGGGQRARLCAVGSLLGAQNTGLFDCSTYLATLSGSTWFAAPWMLSGLSLEEYEKKVIKEFVSASYIPGDFIGLAPASFDAITDIKRVIDNLNVKFAFAQPIGITDIYGALLAKKYLDGLGKKSDPNRCYLASLADSQKMKDGKSLIPIFTAVTADIGLGHVWCDFTPWEFGSRWFGGIRNNGAYIPIWAFGRKFESLKTTKNWGTKESPLYEPMQSMGFLMGIWGLAIAGNCSQAYDQLFSQMLKDPKLGPLKTLVEFFSKDKDFSELRVFYADINNFMYNWPEETKFSKSKYLKLADAGVKYINPIFPTYRRPVQGKNVREGSAPDIIVIWDAGGAKSGTSELIMQSEYAKEHGHAFPKIDLIAGEVSVIKIFTKNPDPKKFKDYEIPTVIYLKRTIDKNLLEKYSKDPVLKDIVARLKNFDLDGCIDNGQCKTFSFKYDADTAQNVIDAAKFNTIASTDEIKKALIERIAVNRARDGIVATPAQALPWKVSPIKASQTQVSQTPVSPAKASPKQALVQVPAKQTQSSPSTMGKK